MADQAEEPETADGQTSLDGLGSGPDQDDTVQVSNNMSGMTVHGPVVQAGNIGTFIQQAPAPPPRSEVTWPLRVGAVPDLVTAHQPRTALQEQIHHAQDTASTVVLSQVLSGGGGVGKTQLAAALAHLAGRTGTDLVLWTDAAGLEQVLGSYAAAAILVQAPGATGQDVEADARAFLNWAATTSRSWLMILDDVTEPAALPGWWPPSGAHSGDCLESGANGAPGTRHRTVITTRLKGADISGGGRRILEITPFAATETTAFLHERLALADADHLLDNSVDEVGAVLGHLPLALGYAAAWMINEDQPCAAYVTHFQKQKQKLGQALPAKWNGEAYGREVAAALLLSLDAAQAAEPAGLAAPALGLAAFLDPAGHPAEFWQTDAVTDYLTHARVAGDGPVLDDGNEAAIPALAESGTGQPEAEAMVEAADPAGGGDRVPAVDPVTARRAMRLLHRYGLITIRREDPHRTVRVHALTARAAREALLEGRKDAVVQSVADGLLELWPEEDHHDLARATVLRVNADHLWPLAGDCLWKPVGHDLLYRAGSTHLQHGMPAMAVAFWKHQVDATERLMRTDHPDILASRSNLAASYWAAGRTSEAIALQKQVLADRERLLGPEHPDTLVSRVNLANSYLSDGHTDEAITLQEQILADRKRLLGDHHADTLSAQANLTSSYQSAERADEALTLDEQVLTGRERLLGETHPDTLLARANLATSYASAGRTDEALTLAERVLADSTRILGETHPDTLLAQANLAATYQSAGRIAEAIALDEQVVANCAHILGETHPHTLGVRANLAHVYWTAGRREEAMELLETAVEDFRRVLGEEHPSTVSVTLGLCLWRVQSEFPS